MLPHAPTPAAERKISRMTTADTEYDIQYVVG
jgi:hypothetical protein